MTIFKGLLTITLLSLAVTISAQGFNIGIRAGLSQSTFRGPVDPAFNESYGFNNGFHFGINYQLNFLDNFGWRSEILYSQVGASYEMDSENGYYVFTLPSDPNYVLRDETQIQLQHSNAYVQFPQTFHASLSRKFEVFGGGYIGFLINPVATGTITFGGANSDKEHRFTQGLNFDYFGDDPFAPPIYNPLTDPNGLVAESLILIRVDGVDEDLRRVENSANFMRNGNTESRFLSIDYGLIGGASYFINGGLYIMGRVEYGLRDITRNSADFSFTEVNDDGSLIYEGDSDKHLGLALSIGFRF